MRLAWLGSCTIATDKQFVDYQKCVSWQCFLAGREARCALNTLLYLTGELCVCSLRTRVHSFTAVVWPQSHAMVGEIDYCTCHLAVVGCILYGSHTTMCQVQSSQLYVQQMGIVSFFATCEDISVLAVSHHSC